MRCWSSPSWRVTRTNRANPHQNLDGPKTKPRATHDLSASEWRRTCWSTGWSHFHDYYKYCFTDGNRKWVDLKGICYMKYIFKHEEHVIWRRIKGHEIYEKKISFTEDNKCSLIGKESFRKSLGQSLDHKRMCSSLWHDVICCVLLTDQQTNKLNQSLNLLGGGN